MVAGEPVGRMWGVRPDELGDEAAAEIDNDVELDQLPAKEAAALDIEKREGGGEVKGRSVKLRGMPRAVAEIVGPGERGGRAVAAAGRKARQPVDGDCDGPSGSDQGWALIAAMMEVFMLPLPGARHKRTCGE